MHVADALISPAVAGTMWAATAGLILCVVSFGKHALSALLPFLVYPVVLIAVGNLPAGYLLRKVLAVAPFALLIGIFNPLLDRAIFLHLGPTGVSGGWISFASITVRFFLTVSAALILIASTGFNAVCPALERIGIPQVFVVQLLFLYRYIFVLMDEAARRPGPVLFVHLRARGWESGSSDP